jgi:succinyl-diaminopimelate desuccinylase
VSEPAEIESLLLALCGIPSVTGDEGPVCDFVQRELVTQWGAESVVRDGHSLVVAPRVERTVPTVVLAGHLDTVKTEHDGPARIEGDRIYGAGAADMKSGLAVMMMLAREMASRSVRYAPIFVFYEREEGPYTENRLGELLDRFKVLQSADVAICLEPSSNVLQLGCVGSLHASVTFRGRTAHSARPWQGDNAVHKAAGLLGRLGAMTPREVIHDGLVYREVISATMAEGGRGRNVVPDTFRLNLNYRFAPGRSLEQAEQDVLDLVRGEAEVEFVDRSPSALPYRGHPSVDALCSAGVTTVEPKQAWTDVARFAQLGVPAVNFGPGTQSQAHQKNEWTDRAELAKGLEIFRRWLFT